MKSESQQALNAIAVEDGLFEDKVWPYKQQAIDARKRFIRDSRIYRDWVKAEDKTDAVALLAERWALQPGKIDGIIDRIRRGDRRIPVEVLAEVKVLEAFKREEILNDTARAMEELDGQIRELEEARLDGTEMVLTKRTDGEKGKDEYLAINHVIKGLYAEKVKLHSEEGSALSHYKRRPPQEIHTSGIQVTIQADADFKHEFERAKKMNKNPIDAEFEEVKETGA